ncbi:MAG: hypothetical protein KF774_05130 [Planctomyces sp.]|nr:hypothetical protein [Planctomyces sp.]
MTINNDRRVSINNQWNNAFLRPARPGWWNRPVGRPDYWYGWGNSVRRHWYVNNYHRRYFYGNWWYDRPYWYGGWHYGWHVGRYPARYWWTVPTWAVVTNWFAWGPAPQQVWAQPVYYDYGPQGNVVYQNNVVTIGGQEVGSPAEFAMSAADLATIPAPETDEQAEAAEWLPLGTFAVSSSDQDVEPTRLLQLAVSREGLISGSLYNTETDEALNVQGQVDRETQRTAFRIGESEDVVVETGLGNLTQDEAAALVHYGPDRTETWLLVRLETPEEDDEEE